MVNDDDDDVVVFPAKAPTVIPSWRSQIIWILFWVFYGRFLSYRAWHSWHSCFSTAHLALSQGLLRIRVLVLEQDGRRALDAARAVAMIDHGLATWMSKSTGLTWLEWTLKLILETGLLFFQVYLQEHMYVYIYIYPSNCALWGKASALTVHEWTSSTYHFPHSARRLPPNAIELDTRHEPAWLCWYCTECVPLGEHTNDKWWL